MKDPRSQESIKLIRKQLEAMKTVYNYFRLSNHHDCYSDGGINILKTVIDAFEKFLLENEDE